MTRLFILLVTMVLASPSWAQDTPIPLIKTSLEENTAIPGQPLVFRITILVPTWMPKPPIFPSFEVPNVIVRLPSRASGPASERVDGQTWSGVTRAYRFYPMVPGIFQIPAGTIHLTYADPETRKPVQLDVTTKPFQINGEAPSGAEDLSPFLAANSVTLERTVDGYSDQLEAGDAITLTTKAKVNGVSPIFIAPFESTFEIEGLRFYTKEPVVEEKEDRGKLSGSRTETVTIVAEFAGDYQIPEASLSWYNLDSGKIGTEKVPAIEFKVTGAAAPTIENSEPVNWRSIGIKALGLMALLALFTQIVRWLVPRFNAFVHRQKTRYRASECFSYRQLKKAIARQDRNETNRAAIIWQVRIKTISPNLDFQPYDNAILKLGLNHYSNQKKTPDMTHTNGWDKFRSTIKIMRQQAYANQSNSNQRSLPSLNPSVKP
ncbi:MAG: BatD family protein [Roseibium sp.]